MDETETARQIADIVREWWQAEGAPMLISALGASRSGEIANAARAISGGLRVFIEQHLADDVLIVQHQARPTIVGAVPHDADDGAKDWNALLDGVTASPAAQARYYSAFWAAFRRPIAEVDSRYLTVSGPVRFIDQSRGGSAPDQMVEVPRGFVASPNASDSEVHEKIDAWLAQSTVSAERFRATGGLGVLPSNDILGRLIQALDPDELAQIRMPMPIVAKLRRKPA